MRCFRNYFENVRNVRLNYKLKEFIKKDKHEKTKVKNKKILN